MSINEKIAANEIRYHWKDAPEGKAKQFFLWKADSLSGRTTAQCPVKVSFNSALRSCQ